MKYEIKEILDYLKIENGTIGSELSYKETHLLLDYITNLQERVNQYENPDDMTLFYMWLDTKAKDKIKELQEYKKVVQMEYKREYAKRYLEERRKEQPNLLYPDSDEIYKRYYELKEENERLKEIINDNMTSYLKGLEDGKDKMKQCFESIYKSRNEKAIEYIKENIRVDDEYPGYMEMLVEEKNELLNILQGKINMNNEEIKDLKRSYDYE